jgi:hypothetical protein
LAFFDLEVPFLVASFGSRSGGAAFFPPFFFLLFFFEVTVAEVEGLERAFFELAPFTVCVDSCFFCVARTV